MTKQTNYLFIITLSTVAASINALATVTYEDLVKQCCVNLSNTASTWISKGLCKNSTLSYVIYRSGLLSISGHIHIKVAN